MSLSARMSTLDFAFGRCVIQASTRQLLIDGQPARIGARAFDVLMTLVDRRDAVVSKNDLLDTVWPGLIVEENNLQVHVSTLRKLLGPQMIVTIPGRGYRFSAESQSPVHAREPERTLMQPSSPAQPTTAARVGNLPEQMPTLFGRDAEIATLGTMLTTQRLITITGAGGMGKTRLAHAAALAARKDNARYPDGVWLVELAPINDGRLVLASIARTLGVALATDATADELATRIDARQMLLVLDNCEHLVDQVASVVSALLRAAVNITILATSQESLKIADEYVFRLGTLSLPAVEASAKSMPVRDQDFADFGALALFAARAREAAPHFVLNDDNRGAIIEICRRLDGIPLAIEFATGRLPLLGVEGLRARLDDRFRLLTSGARLAPRRQQTLRAALEWSHSLLTPEEQMVFRRLAIFSGSFSLEASQWVGVGEEFDEWTVLDHLGALVDKSLVINQPGAVPRYRLLESTRAFAFERLQAAGELPATARRHADAVLKQFEITHAQLWTANSDALLETTLPDIDNLRAALNWAVGDSGNPEQLVALVGASGWLWKPADSTAEGRVWFERAIPRITAATPPALEARLLLGYASYAHQAAAHKEVPALQRAAMLYRGINDRRHLYETLVTLAQKLVWVHEHAAVEQSLQEADQLFDPAWPPTMREGQLVARTYLFEVMDRAADGQPLMEELVALMRASGDARKLDFALMQLAENLFIQGKAAEAIAVRREIAQRIGVRRVNYAGTNLGNLCAALVFQDEVDEALQVAVAALAPLQHIGSLHMYEDHFALLAFKLGRYAAAAQLLGRSNMNFTASGFQREQSELRAARMTMEGLQKVLPEDELERLLAQGAAMTDEAAVRVGLGADRRGSNRAAVDPA